MSQQKQSGFTIIEGALIVVVVGIIGALGWKFYDAMSAKNASSSVRDASQTELTAESLEGLSDISSIQTKALTGKGDTSVIGIELKNKKGTTVYEVTLSDGTHSVYNAKTGEQISSDNVEVSEDDDAAAMPAGFTGGIGFTKAIEIARAAHDDAVLKVEIETEEGVVVYSVRFADKARVDVNAETGAITRQKAAKKEAKPKKNETSTVNSSRSRSGSSKSDKSSKEDKRHSSHDSGGTSGKSSDGDDDHDDDKSGSSGKSDSDHDDDEENDRDGRHGGNDDDDHDDDD